MTNWVQAIPSRIRAIIYVAVGAATVIVAAVSHFYDGSGWAVPAWVGGVASALAFVAGIFNLVAAGNTAATDDPAAADVVDVSDAEGDTVGAIEAPDDDGGDADVVEDDATGKHAANVPAE